MNEPDKRVEMAWITEKRHQELLRCEEQLDFLEARGVDNWTGYAVCPERSDYESEDEFLEVIESALEDWGLVTMDKAAKLAMTEAYKVLQDCLSAISTMEPDALGLDAEFGYTYRDELESYIVQAQLELGEFIPKEMAKSIESRDPFKDIRVRRQTSR